MAATVRFWLQQDRPSTATITQLWFNGSTFDNDYKYDGFNSYDFDISDNTIMSKKGDSDSVMVVTDGYGTVVHHDCVWNKILGGIYWWCNHDGDSIYIQVVYIHRINVCTYTI